MATATTTRSHLDPKSPQKGSIRRTFLDRIDLDRFVLPAPALILVLLLLAFPVGFTLYMSVHTWSGGRRPPQFVGLDNFARSLADERFWASLWHTVQFVSLSVGAQVLLGLIAALIFHQKFFGRGAVRAFYLFPMIATPTAIALVWKMMFDPTLGVLSYLSQSVGGPPVTWTSDPQLIRAWGRRLGLTLAIAALLIPAAFVFFWMVTSSLKQGVDIYTMPPKWLDFTPTWDNYARAFQRTPFLLYAGNSMLVATAASLFGLVIGVPAAYTIARYNQKRLALSLLTARLLPGVAFLVPFFILFTQLRMMGSYPAIILGHILVTFPLTVFIMVNFFEGIPEELYDAGEVDGCTRFGVFFRVALPLTRSGLVTSGILAFVFSWNDFKMALVLSNAQTRTLPVAVYNFINEASLEWGPMMAYATVITVPVIIIAIFAQKHIVTGMTLGSGK